MAREPCNILRWLGIPEPEHSPMEHRGLSIDHLSPFSVESAQQAVASGTHPGSGGLLHGPDSEQLQGFGEVNTIAPYEERRVPFVRLPAGQATSSHPSGGIGAWVEIYPPTHVPGGGKYGLYSIGERGQEVTLSNGQINGAE